MDGGEPASSAGGERWPRSGAGAAVRWVFGGGAKLSATVASLSGGQLFRSAGGIFDLFRVAGDDGWADAPAPFRRNGGGLLPGAYRCRPMAFSWTVQGRVSFSTGIALDRRGDFFGREGPFSGHLRHKEPLLPVLFCKKVAVYPKKMKKSGKFPVFFKKTLEIFFATRYNIWCLFVD